MTEELIFGIFKKNKMIEDNIKFINEFLGWKFYPEVNIETLDYHNGIENYYEISDYNVWVLNPTKEFDNHLRVYDEYYKKKGINTPYENYCYTLPQFKEWNSVMKLVDKIESLGFTVSINRANVVIGETNGTSPNGYQFVPVVNGKKIETTLEACFRFVEWYKKEKQK